MFRSSHGAAELDSVEVLITDSWIDKQYRLTRVDSGRGQNRTLRPLSTPWPPVFAGEQDVGPPKG